MAGWVGHQQRVDGVCPSVLGGSAQPTCALEKAESW